MAIFGICAHIMHNKFTKVNVYFRFCHRNIAVSATAKTQLFPLQKNGYMIHLGHRGKR